MCSDEKISFHRLSDIVQETLGRNHIGADAQLSPHTEASEYHPSALQSSLSTTRIPPAAIVSSGIASIFLPSQIVEVSQPEAHAKVAKLDVKFRSELSDALCVPVPQVEDVSHMMMESSQQAPVGAPPDNIFLYMTLVAGSAVPDGFLSEFVLLEPHVARSAERADRLAMGIDNMSAPVLKHRFHSVKSRRLRPGKDISLLQPSNCREDSERSGKGLPTVGRKVAETWSETIELAGSRPNLSFWRTRRHSMGRLLVVKLGNAKFLGGGWPQGFHASKQKSCSEEISCLVDRDV